MLSDAERDLLRQDEVEKAREWLRANEKLKWELCDRRAYSRETAEVILMAAYAEFRLAAARAGERETLDDVANAPRETIMVALKAAREQLLMAHEDMNQLRIALDGERWRPLDRDAPELPAEGRKVLTFGSGSAPYMHVSQFHPRISACDWNFGFPANVTHWRPLPSPPAESEAKHG